jgi:hypothetical protein
MRRVSQQEWENANMALEPNMTATPNNEAVGVSVEDEYLSLLDWLFKESGFSNDDPIYSMFSAFLPKLQSLTPSPADAEKPVEVSGYIATVPDNCDRIIWRGHYHHLPTTPPASVPVSELLALATKWRSLAEKFDAAGGDVSKAEAASMRNDANELTALAQEHDQ